MGILRTADGPLMSRQIVLALQRAKGVTEPSRKQIRNLYGGIQASLHYYRQSRFRKRAGGLCTRSWRYSPWRPTLPSPVGPLLSRANQPEPFPTILRRRPTFIL
jgi:hypothetical protein